MPDIEIDESQRQYLETLRSQLADEHVGDYGYVRLQDALQYLIDQHEASDADLTSASASETESASDEAAETASEATGSDSPESGSAESKSADETAGSRLQRMMGLLDRHDDKWAETDSEEGKYAVELPDGTTDNVRTKDDVRALLFKHYD